MPITNEEIIIWNQEGIIPGPNETEEEFRKRAEYCLQLKSKFNESLQPHIQPFKANDEAQPEESTIFLEEAFPLSRKYFGITPHWIPFFFSNYKLTFWQGGCAWIFQWHQDDPIGALFQLRKTFKTSQTYLGLYSRKELIAHELAHVGRMAFNDPCFEEIIAYSSSPSKFRRYFSPIVQTGGESMLFMLSLLLVVIVDFSLILLGNESQFIAAMWLKFFPLFLLGYGLIRLWFRHRIFDRCLSILMKVFGSEEKGRSIIFRLSDKEIKKIASMTSQDNGLEVIQNILGENHLRWRIFKLYLN